MRSEESEMRKKRADGARISERWKFSSVRNGTGEQGQNKQNRASGG